MSQPYCHHINAAGVFCRGIPVKKHDYCYWHLHERGRRMRAARARARRERVLMQLPVLDDLQAVQVSLMQLGEAVRHGDVDQSSGRLLLGILRLAASNLKARAIWEQGVGVQDADLEGYVEEDADFEEQYGLPKDFDLSVEPEVAFPPPAENVPQVRDLPLGANLGDSNVRARFGQILRDAATPIPGTSFHATADDMELIDVYEREGEQAGLQRATVLERNRKRREARERRLHYEQMARNRNIQMAAEKLVRDQQRAAEAAREGAIEGRAQADANRKPPQSEGSVVPASEVGAAVA